MHRTARRSWLKWLGLALLILPAFSAGELPEDWFPGTPAVPFLTAVDSHSRAVQTLARNAIIPALSLTPPLPVVVDPKPSTPQAVDRRPIQGTAASFATPVTSGAYAAFVVVAEGETLWEIAQRHGVTVEALAAANGIGDKDLLAVGQQLVIPGTPAGRQAWPPTSALAGVPPTRPRQLTVRVREGETLWEIAQAYGISVNEIAEINGLPDGESVRTGQRLVIPGGALDVLREVTSAREASASIAQSFVWPARGQLTSRFGWRVTGHHNGVDIAAPRGTPIAVAKAGRVVFAGWYFGYGQAVIVDHGQGVTTIYGHASKLLVTIGQDVEAGQVIALVGSTGDATGPHLHFEIRVNGRPLNPMKYL